MLRDFFFFSSTAHCVQLCRDLTKLHCATSRQVSTIKEFKTRAALFSLQLGGLHSLKANRRQQQGAKLGIISVDFN